MTTAYNPMYTHRLEPISGFDEITHLQFIAPMETKDLERNNGSGEEFGLPAGSVVSLNPNTHAFTAGATGTAMPCFLLWNTSDPDGYPSALTANGRHLAGIPATGAARVGQGSVLDSAELIRNLYQRSGGTATSERTYTEDNKSYTETSTYSYTNATTGGGASVGDRTEISTGGNVISYKLRQCAGAFTAWPATCGLELDSTEFDKSVSYSDFKPNTLLKAPRPIETNELTGNETEEVKFQKLRGGFLTPITVSDITTTSPFSKTVTGDNNSSVTSVDFNVDEDMVNVCGTVSKGIHKNENGVDVLYFWAERTIFPKTYVAGTT